MLDVVKVIDDETEIQWLEFLADIEEDKRVEIGAKATAYHSLMYKRMIEECGLGDPFYLMAVEYGRVRGILPGFVKTTSLGTVYCSMPLYGPYGGILTDGDDWEVYFQLLGRVWRHMTSRVNPLTMVVYAGLLETEEGLSHYRQNLPDHIESVRVNQVMHLPTHTVSMGKRQYIRKAEGLGIDVSQAYTQEEFDAFYAMYRKQCAEKGYERKAEDVQRYLCLEGSRDGHVRTYLAWHNHKLVAGMILLMSGKTVHYHLVARVDCLESNLYGIHLCHYAIEEMKALGYEWWDWGSNPGVNSGTWNYKEEWGGVATEQHIFTVPFVPEERLRDITGDRMAREFPWYYVYPYDRLRSTKEDS